METFITDLAGYYHSLLLLKAGVSREAILGYPPARFSKAVLDKYDTVRLARAGELLYDLHRNIRYSVSPRFELETLASEFCWLDKWISAPELGAAVAEAREALGSAEPRFPSGDLHRGSAEPRFPSGGTSRPLAEGNSSGALDPGEFPRTSEGVSTALGGDLDSNAASSFPSGDISDSGEVDSLSEGFSRYMAARANLRQNPANSPEKQAVTPADFGTPTERSVASEKRGSLGTPTEQGEGSPLDPGVQKVLEVFRGTIIEENRE